MNRKLLFAFVVLIAAVAALGIVSAGQQVSVDGVFFTLPDGYSPVNSSSEAENLGIYSDNQGSLIMIFVDNQSDIKDYQNNHSYSAKTIGSQQGYFKKIDNSVEFIFQKDSHTVTVFAKDEADLEALLK